MRSRSDAKICAPGARAVKCFGISFGCYAGDAKSKRLKEATRMVAASRSPVSLDGTKSQQD